MIAVSAASMVDVLAAYPALDPARVHVVHNGIDTDLYRPDRGDRRRRPDRRRPGPPVSCRSSGGSPARRACPTCCGPRWTSIPPPSSCCSPARRTRRSWPPRPTPRWPGCAPSATACIWIGDVAQSRADVAQVLSHATVFVCPSIYEPLGIVNLEAMACATAVVASDVGGIPEVVVDGDDRPAGALRRRPSRPRSRPTSPPPSTASSATRRWPRRMGAAGRERAVRDFGWDAAARKTLAIYESLGSTPMKLATIRIDGGHRAVRIDDDTATLLDAAGRRRPARHARVGPAAAAAGDRRRAATVDGLDYAPLDPVARTRSSASG